MLGRLLYPFKEVAYFIGLSSTYTVLALAVLKFSYINGNATIFWPSAGLGLAALILFGIRIWPSIFVGALLSGLIIGDSIFVSSFIAVGNVLESIIGCFLLTRFRNFNSSMVSVNDLFILIIVAVFSSVVSALIGPLTLYISDFTLGFQLLNVMFHWWQADVLGIMVVTPLILTWQHWPIGWKNDCIIFFLLSFLAGGIIFLNWFQVYLGSYAWAYWMFLVIGFAAVHYGRHGVVVITLMTTIQALTGVSLNIGFFKFDLLNTQLLNFWTYILVLSNLGFYLACIIEDQKKIYKSLNITNYRCKGILENMMDAFLRLDTNGNILEANLSMSMMSGYSVDELLHMNVSKLEVIESLEVIQKHIQNIINNGHDLFESKHRCKNGDIIDVEISSYLSSDDLHNVYAFHRNITNRKLASRELTLESLRLRTILETASDGIHVMDQNGNILQFSHAFSRMLGYSSKETAELKVFDWDCLKSKEEILQAFSQLGDDPISFETKHRRRDGTIIDVEITARSVVLDGQKSIYASSRDITNRKINEAELRIAATAFESKEGILVTDSNYLILRANSAFSDITGYSAKEVLGRNPRLLSSGRHDKFFYDAMWEKINKLGSWEGEIWNRRKNGEIYPEYLTITSVKDTNRKVTNYVATFNDITINKAADDEIKNLAFFDPLTKLPNRRLFHDRLNQALVSSTRNGQQGAILFIDLDHFKIINDTLGHTIGDLLLQKVAERITTCLREGDTVARIGGDEFVVLLESLGEHLYDVAAQVEVISNKILSSINQLYQLHSHEYYISSSIGATIINGSALNSEDLLKQADIAMYQAKKAGRNTLRFFDPVMQESINVRATLEKDLRNAIAENELRLYYQVQVDKSGYPFGAEALIRWHHPERGLVSPVNFIPLAEETGLILPIGLWVIEKACAQLKAWAQNEITRELTISINISAVQFNNANFLSQVKFAVQNNEINPKHLKLELTESMLIDNIDQIIITMEALQNIGVCFELDDFGTGYSSMQYLKKLPLQQLKIDQSFVRDLVEDTCDQTIVGTIIAMANSLEIEVIAEGVETEEQKIILLNKGCSRYQGYLFGKPVSIEQFEAELNLF